MPDAASVLLQRLQAAFDTIVPGADPVLRVSDRADFQANGALPLAKVVGRPPRQVAEEVVAAASLDDICAQVQSRCGALAADDDCTLLDVKYLG